MQDQNDEIEDVQDGPFPVEQLQLGLILNCASVTGYWLDCRNPKDSRIERLSRRELEDSINGDE
ncbi:hypothetical protein KY285_000958 [Solanum tuberosum]|nr:hypothetical protein KY285_000958 [Solanum tuberosum]